MKKIIVAEKTVESYLTKSKIGQFAINPYVAVPMPANIAMRHL